MASLDLAHLTEQYYQHHRFLKRRDKTIKWHRTSHRLFFRMCGIKSPDDITRESVRNFIYLNAQAGKSSESIRTYVRSIKAFYNWLLEEEYVDREIFRKKLELPPVDEKPPKLILREDLRKIMNSLYVYPYYRSMLERLRTKSIFSLYMNTGMRKTEILGIRMEHVRLKERIILVCHDIKTRDYRNVVVNNELHRELEEYLEYLKEIRVRNEFLFFMDDPDLPMSESSLRRMQKRMEAFARRRFKTKRFCLNMFRHSYISYGIADGLSIPFIMNQVGHRRITTTQGYTHTPQKEMVQSLSNYSLLRP